MKWYRDRDGNLLPRPASDDPYLDAWLEDYCTSHRTAERVALKSAYARREVPLTATMAEALRELRPVDPRAAEGPVFVDWRGNPIAHTRIQIS